MHAQGGSRRDPGVRPGDIVHERTREEHAYEVADVTSDTITLLDDDGEEHLYGAATFATIFEVA